MSNGVPCEYYYRVQEFVEMKTLEELDKVKKRRDEEGQTTIEELCQKLTLVFKIALSNSVG